MDLPIIHYHRSSTTKATVLSQKIFHEMKESLEPNFCLAARLQYFAKKGKEPTETNSKTLTCMTVSSPSRQNRQIGDAMQQSCRDIHTIHTNKNDSHI